MKELVQIENDVKPTPLRVARDVWAVVADTIEIGKFVKETGEFVADKVRGHGFVRIAGAVSEIAGRIANVLAPDRIDSDRLDETITSVAYIKNVVSKVDPDKLKETAISVGQIKDAVSKVDTDQLKETANSVKQIKDAVSKVDTDQLKETAISVGQIKDAVSKVDTDELKETVKSVAYIKDAVSRFACSRQCGVLALVFLILVLFPVVRQRIRKYGSRKKLRAYPHYPQPHTHRISPHSHARFRGLDSSKNYGPSSRYSLTAPPPSAPQL